jgi:CBS domain containing-hemolysin-like protein
MAETVGTYVAAELGVAPGPGASVTLGGFRLTVLESRDGLIRRLRAQPEPETRPLRSVEDRGQHP